MDGSATADGGALARRVGWSGLAQVLPLLAQLVLTPYLISVLGLDGFGLWSLVLVFVATLTALDGGIGASLARFFAVHTARQDPEGAGRLLFGAVLVFVVLGIGVTGLVLVLAPFLVGWLDLAPVLRGQAVDALRWLGLLVLLALLHGAVVALLQANQRFTTLAASTGTAQLAYIVAAVALLRPGDAVSVLVWVLAIRYATGVLLGFTLGRRLVRFTRPLLPTRPERAAFRSYAGRMQLSSMTSFLNGEFDALVVAALLPVRYVGIFAAAHQVAAAARSLPLYAFPPFLTTLANAFARRGESGVVAEFDRIQARWLPLVLGYTAVAACAALFAVPIWLGDAFQVAGALAAILTLGYGLHVALTGMRTCFVRSIGRPGLETRYSIFSTVVNVALTVPLALAFGIVGVVTATAVALVLASLYFIWLCRRFAIHDQPPHPTWWPAIVLAAGVTVAGEVGVRSTGWHGPLAVALAGVPALLGLGVLLLPLRAAGAVRSRSTASQRS